MLKIKEVKYDNDFTYGCETCDYGSNYVSNIEFLLEDGTPIKIETEQMYEYTLTESDYMQLLANSNDIQDFYRNMFKLIKEKSYNIECRVDLQEMEMKINGNKIDIIESCKSGRLIEKVKE